MSVHWRDDSVTLHHGDCLDVLRELPDASVDAVVTDPPYGLEFMGREWDGANGFRRSLNAADVGRDSVFGRASRTSPEYRAGHLFQAWCEQWATECLRVLKPGGHMLAFGGTRTWHRLAAAIEDAGFEIRDSIAWLYGSGFPKSLDVSKAIDRAAGAEREVVGFDTRSKGIKPGTANYGGGGAEYQAGHDITAPATPDAERWQGWGTALKPAFEPIVVARKPLSGTVAANVIAHGTGALNVDACRVGSDGGTAGADRGPQSDVYGDGLNGAFGKPVPGLGRWPANVTLDEHQAAQLDQQSGTSAPKSARTGRKGGMGDNGTLRGAGSGSANPADFIATWPDDPGGGASRFFPVFRYEAKAPTTERPRIQREDGTVEAHATVKPLDLMRWLVRLVTPPGGTVLEPFAGSGTTAEACVLEGFHCIAIEREADYLPLIVQRLSKPLQPGLGIDFGDGAA